MTITVTKKAVEYLHDVVAAPGWTKSTKEIIVGGKLACRLGELLKDKPTDTAAIDAWDNTQVELSLHDTELAAGQTAIRFYADRLPVNIHSATLLESLNLNT